MSVSKVPFNKPSLKDITPADDAVRVLNLLFDSNDESRKLQDLI